MVVSRVAYGHSVSVGKVTNAKMLYSALKATWERLHSSCNSIAFVCELIPNEDAFTRHAGEARCSQVSREDISSCVFPETAIPVEIGGEEKEKGFCLAAVCSSGL